MWQEITAHINDVVLETRSLPAPPGQLGEVKTHIDQLPAAMQQVEKVQQRIIQHVERSTELINTALLHSTQSTTDNNDALQSYTSQASAEIEQVSGELQSLMQTIGSFRSLLGQDSGALKSEAMQARARIKALEERQRELSAKAQELRNRSAWTWLFPPAKAIDELVSLCQHGKSTEAALEDAIRELGDKRREASNLIRISDVCEQLLSLLSAMAEGLQGVINQQALFKGYLSNEDRLASLTTPDNARLYLNTVLGILRMMRAQAN
jgi:DNA repair exonuclease SbcCD ATPase subunit